MSSKRMQFKENLRESCMKKKAKKVETCRKETGEPRKSESPLPPSFNNYTAEELAQWDDIINEVFEGPKGPSQPNANAKESQQNNEQSYSDVLLTTPKNKQEISYDPESGLNFIASSDIEIEVVQITGECPEILAPLAFKNNPDVKNSNAEDNVMLSSQRIVEVTNLDNITIQEGGYVAHIEASKGQENAPYNAVNFDHYEMLPELLIDKSKICSSNNGKSSAKMFNSNDPTLSSVNAPPSCVVSLIESNKEDFNSVALSPTTIDQPLTPMFIPLSVQSVQLSSPANDIILPHNNRDADDTDSEISEEEWQLGARKKRRRVKRKNEGKGRKVHKNKWLDVKRKTNKNLGKAYRSRNGKQRPARQMKPSCTDTCKLKCFQKLTTSERKSIFDSFWKLGDNTRQWDFISNYCNKVCPRRRTTENDSRRNYTIKYALPKSIDSTSSVVPVCKIMFLNSLGIGAGMVSTALKKLETGNGVISSDGRGAHKNRKIVIDEEMIKSVCDHVNSLQPVESHYVRSRTSKLYLDESLSYNRLFLLYLEWIDVSKYKNPAQTLRQYRDIVNCKFNISFHVPRKDQCDECHVYKNLPKPILHSQYKSYNDHILNKNIARELKSKYKSLSITSPNEINTTTFDFQKIHGMPHGQTSILYYKRKLSVYNLTFYNLGQKEATCYVWDETTAKKGATEVATCIYKYIKEHCEKGIKTFYFFSDNCGGQNRNRIVFMAYLQASRDFNVAITHTFLERGHTQNEGDSVHALIERFSKNKVVYTPDEWYNIIRWCKQDGKPYRVVEMETSEFLDFKTLLTGINWVKNTQGDKMFWSQVRQLQVVPTEIDRIYYKTDFCEHEFKCIVLYRVSTRAQQRKECVSRSLSKAYPKKFGVPKDKLKDLKYLCDHLIIPLKYHSYYQSLVPSEEKQAAYSSDE